MSATCNSVFLVPITSIFNNISHLQTFWLSGYYSWRNPKQGSWFIQALCDELRLNGRTRDLLTILTFVCRRVAIDYRSNVPGNEAMDLMKQIPTITSMLTRLVYFRQKQRKL
jgi:caspase-like apoptosis-related cysteine protease